MSLRAQRSNPIIVIPADSLPSVAQRRNLLFPPVSGGKYKGGRISCHCEESVGRLMTLVRLLAESNLLCHSRARGNPEIPLSGEGTLQHINA
jgi:hypothetical protein